MRTGVYFVVGGSRAGTGWLVVKESRVASHELTIVQIITSPLRRSPPEKYFRASSVYFATLRRVKLRPHELPSRYRFNDIV